VIQDEPPPLEGEAREVVSALREHTEKSLNLRQIQALLAGREGRETKPPREAPEERDRK
jgi:hypothetical protein